MASVPTTQDPSPRRGIAYRWIAAIGTGVLRLFAGIRDRIAFIGGLVLLLADVLRRAPLALLFGRSRLGRQALLSQMVRVGVRSIPIIVLVEVFIGVILALQMAPTLDSYGQKEKVADIVGIAIFRELGPLISAIVLSGFAGASIAAEIGAMVEGEEVKALRAMALHPVQFLVVPRVLATATMLVGLAVIADIVGVLGGLITAVGVLKIDHAVYLQATQQAVAHRDFLTGLVKAGVFGLLISLIACYEGLNVRGGAVGVGNATTATVVKSIVALIATDCLFTAFFYSMGW